MTTKTDLEELRKYLILKFDKADTDPRYYSGDYRFRQLSIVEVQTKLGRKYKKRLSQIKTILTQYQHAIDDEKQLIVPIATTNKYLLKLLNTSQVTLSNIRDSMVAIDLIYCVDTQYSFCTPENQHDHARSKLFIINKPLAKRILQESTVVTKEFSTEFWSGAKEHSSVDWVFNSKLKGILRESYTDEQIFSGLRERYSHVEYYEKLMTINNSKLQNTQWHQRFEPNIELSSNKKFIKKIGIRPAHSLVSMRRSVRDKYLESYFSGSYVENDVTSSIFTINHFLLTGEWLRNHDFYRQFLGRDFDSSYNYMDAQGKERNSEREFVKLLALQVFFGTSPEKTLNNIISKMRGNGVDKAILSALKKGEVMYHKALSFITEYYNNMHIYNGNRLDSEIFLHEGCIYIAVLNRILNRGIDCFQVYDGFYTKEGIEDFEHIVEEEAKKYLSRANKLFQSKDKESVNPNETINKEYVNRNLCLRNIKKDIVIYLDKDKETYLYNSTRIENAEGRLYKKLE